MLPLQGVRVLAVEQFGAGPFSTLQLADLGAEVVKIEDPTVRGDVGRYVPPFQEGERSLYFESLNRNKKSVSLDLRTPGGRAVFERLVGEADAVFSNLRGDQPSKLGLTYETLGKINPRIVCCSLSGFGMTGPRADQGGYDYMMQGLAGWMSLTGDPDGPPTKSGLSLVDLSAGYVAAIALLGGLARAGREGVGCDCDVSLFETALGLLSYIGTWSATADYAPQRMAESAHPSIVPFQALPTADGWIVVACAKEKFWRLLCDALERPELAADPRFVDFAARSANRDELLEILRATFRAAPTAVWVDKLRDAGVPSAPINSVGEALQDPQIAARDGILEVDHPDFGRVRHVASPLRIDQEERVAPVRAPYRGEHTLEALRGAGYTAEQIAELIDGGAFGDVDVHAEPGVRA